MSNLSLNSRVQQNQDKQQIDLRAVWVFCVVTVVFSVSLFLLLPGMAGPVIGVFIPTVTAVTLISLTVGISQVRPRLFSTRAWHISLKWLFISLGVALALRLGVSLLGLLLIPDYQWDPSLALSLLPLTLLYLVSAAGEEIGWRGFALPTMLAYSYRPLAAALILGVPWALLHLPLVLPGMLSAGASPLASFLNVMALSVLVTWAYLAAGYSLSAAVLLHAGQSIFGFLNYGLDPVASSWLVAAAYTAAALLVIFLTRGRLGLPETAVTVIENP